MGLMTGDGRLREERARRGPRRPGGDGGRGPGGGDPRSPGSAAVLAVVCLGLLLSMYNATVVNVMLPDMRVSLHASGTGLAWVAALYSLVYAALLMAGGALGARVGRRAAFLGGVALFTAGSAACAAAPGLGFLLCARAVQAVGVAALIPQTLSILVTEYADPARRARAIGVWAGVASIGLAAGPVVGGAITEAASWRAGFWVSVALGAVTVAVGPRVVSRSRYGRPARPAAPDLAGAGLSVLALGALVYGLIESSALGWGSPLIIGALAVAVAAAAGFVASQGRAAGRGRQPLMPLELWRSGRFIAANLSALGYFVLLYGILYFYSIDLQQYHRYSTLGAGLAFLPMTVLMAVLGPVAGRLSARFSTAPVMVAGLLAAAAGALCLALDPAGGSALDLGWRFALIGLGAGLMNSPMSNTAVSSADARHSGAASATHNTFRQIGGTLGVAALGTIVAAGHHATASPAAFQAGLGHAFIAVAALLAICAVAVTALAKTRTGKRPHGKHSGGAQAPPTAVAADPGPVQPGRAPGAEGRGPARPVRLVVGFDNSESARRALAWGANVLRGGHGTLHVIYADRVLIASDLPGFARAGMDRARDEKAADVAETAAQIAATAGVPHTFERRPESPADAILIAADAEDAAEPVIVVGRSHHAARQVIGSVPDRLLRRSPYPVLTVS
jgi:EmrB/QacA subfamily drug resistance transporter